MVTTKWTRPAATDGLSYSPTAPSSAKSASTAVTRSPSPHVDGPLLQQPASRPQAGDSQQGGCDGLPVVSYHVAWWARCHWRRHRSRDVHRGEAEAQGA